MKFISLATILTLAAGPAFSAGLMCKFTTECFDTEGCSDTDYEVEVIYNETNVTISDVSGDKIGWIQTEEEMIYVTTDDAAAGTETAIRVAPSKDARLVTIDTTVPYAILYAGTCEPK